MKLELRTTIVQDESSADLSSALDALEKQLADAEAKIRVLNNTVARDAEARKRHEEVEERLRNELKALREGGSAVDDLMSKKDAEIEKHKAEIVKLKERIAQLEQSEGKVVEKI